MPPWSFTGRSRANNLEVIYNGTVAPGPMPRWPATTVRRNAPR
jgi:hypothetical protein